MIAYAPCDYSNILFTTLSLFSVIYRLVNTKGLKLINRKYIHYIWVVARCVCNHVFNEDLTNVLFILSCFIYLFKDFV